ncbi:MAG TPA: ABC transporter permease, partial [Clostridium sp.]
NKNIVVSMMISGALSGLAGVTQYIGNASNMQIGVMPSQGFDGIAVSLLGANNPIGIFISAIFFGLLYSGKGFMNANTSIPPEIADTIIAIIIYFAAISAAVPIIVNKIKHKRAIANAKKTGDSGIGILPSENANDEIKSNNVEEINDKEEK